jgi:hypothetical protein
MTVEAEEPTGTSTWSDRWQSIAAVAWPSFLAASLATMVFFAFFDPLHLGPDEEPPAWLANRMTGYAVGFFFFWAITLVSSAITAYLLRTRHYEEPPPTPSWMRDAP